MKKLRENFSSRQVKTIWVSNVRKVSCYFWQQKLCFFSLKGEFLRLFRWDEKSWKVKIKIFEKRVDRLGGLEYNNVCRLTKATTGEHSSAG
jgi:hypothetical protein